MNINPITRRSIINQNKLKMKNLLKNGVFLLIAGAFLFGCSNQRAEDLLKDPDKQNDLMTAICTDHQMMTNMMDHMMKNDHAMQMMMGNQEMMSQMMQGEHAMGMMEGNHEMMGNMMQHMMKMMQKDTSMCRMMGEMMMKDDHTKGMMMDMMKEKDKKDHENQH